MSNTAISEQLQRLADMHDTLGSTYRARAYNTASKNVLKAATITLKNIEEMKIPGIGDGIREKIIEFLRTGKNKEIEDNRAHNAAAEELSVVLGAGPVTVNKWIAAGITTLAALRSAVERGEIHLNNMQTVGLKYAEDLRERIPRAEVTEIVGKIGAVILRVDPAAIVTCAGSYRRGAESSGDIDIIMTNRARFRPELLREVATAVAAAPGFVAQISEGEERYTFLYRNCEGCRVRQVDILNIPYVAYYPSLLYFTGSWDFNEAMRGHAKGLGYRLNQHGLFKDGNIIPVTSEEEIFHKIGLKYVVPADRRGRADVVEN